MKGRSRRRSGSSGALLSVDVIVLALRWPDAARQSSRERGIALVEEFALALLPAYTLLPAACQTAFPPQLDWLLRDPAVRVSWLAGPIEELSEEKGGSPTAGKRDALGEKATTRISPGVGDETLVHHMVTPGPTMRVMGGLSCRKSSHLWPPC
jgi:hypothetical protein